MAPEKYFGNDLKMVDWLRLLKLKIQSTYSSHFYHFEFWEPTYLLNANFAEKTEYGVLNEREVQIGLEAE